MLSPESGFRISWAMIVVMWLREPIFSRTTVASSISRTSRDISSYLLTFSIVIPYTGIRHRRLSVLRLAVCLILGPVFVLWIRAPGGCGGWLAVDLSLF